jgi:hypothetical protein
VFLRTTNPDKRAREMAVGKPPHGGDHAHAASGFSCMAYLDRRGIAGQTTAEDRAIAPVGIPGIPEQAQAAARRLSKDVFRGEDLPVAPGPNPWRTLMSPNEAEGTNAVRPPARLASLGAATGRREPGGERRPALPRAWPRWSLRRSQKTWRGAPHSPRARARGGQGRGDDVWSRDPLGDGASAESPDTTPNKGCPASGRATFRPVMPKEVAKEAKFAPVSPGP